jgi:small subunit ribosomal protein S11
MAQAKRKDKAKKRVVVVESVGQVHIRATFNNIIISITNMNGQVISWASAGKMGFRGSKKNTPTLLRQRHRTARRLPMNWVCVKQKCS